jgi:hypothetical protein
MRFDVAKHAFLQLISVWQNDQAVHFVTLGPLGLREKSLKVLYEVVAVAGDDRKASLPGFPSNRGIGGAFRQSDICKRLRTFFREK